MAQDIKMTIKVVFKMTFDMASKEISCVELEQRGSLESDKSWPASDFKEDRVGNS